MPGKIYTKKGDKGETSLFTGERVNKTDLRVESYGTIDELNACLGIAKIFSSERISTIIHEIQIRLFYLISELATADPSKVIKKTESEDINYLEKLIDEISDELPPIENFVIPGGTKAAAFLHQSRTICRRAERNTIKFSKMKSINLEIIRYLNRLSDLLFVLSRYSNIVDGDGDILISREGIKIQSRK